MPESKAGRLALTGLFSFPRPVDAERHGRSTVEHERHDPLLAQLRAALLERLDGQQALTAG
ncbi:hypothetical protein WI36_04320 [Burkholderia ubonensis]|nr:hypothetical protein WI36_04320 [Burkholderia ubonensis]